jgi:hypothetical protein
MKGWSGYQNSPMKHVLPGNETHVHDSSFDVDTSEDEFSKEDKRIYVTNKDKKEKKVKEEEVIPEGSYYIDTGDGEKTLYTPPKKKKKKNKKIKVKKIRVKKRKNPKGKLMDLGY